MPTEEDAGYSHGAEMIHSLPSFRNGSTVATVTTPQVLAVGRLRRPMTRPDKPAQSSMPPSAVRDAAVSGLIGGLIGGVMSALINYVVVGCRTPQWPTPSITPQPASPTVFSPAASDS